MSEKLEKGCLIRDTLESSNSKLELLDLELSAAISELLHEIISLVLRNVLLESNRFP